jgi:glycosyltransferase 2 family protein
LKQALKYLISLGLAAALLWYTLKDYNWASNWAQIQNANWLWVIVAAFFTLLAHISRAIRWRMLLQPLGFTPTVVNTTLAVCMGYFANYLLPRLGEVTRCGSLQTTEAIPLQKSLGTVVTERLVDVLILLGIFALNFLLEFDRLSAYFISFFKKSQSTAIPIWVYLIIAFLFSVICLFVFRKKIVQLSVFQKFITVFKGFAEGLTSISKLQNPVAFIGHSLFIWLCYYLSTYFTFFALPQTSGLGPLAALSTLTSGAVGVAAPTPGGLGTYHALVSKLLTLYGLSPDAGKTLAIFAHGSQMAITIVFGLVSLIWLLARPKKANNII